VTAVDRYFAIGERQHCPERALYCANADLCPEPVQPWAGDQAEVAGAGDR
jgi:hypothetical protein